MQVTDGIRPRDRVHFTNRVGPQIGRVVSIECDQEGVFVEVEEGGMGWAFVPPRQITKITYAEPRVPLGFLHECANCQKLLKARSPRSNVAGAPVCGHSCQEEQELRY